MQYRSPGTLQLACLLFGLWASAAFACEACIAKERALFTSLGRADASRAGWWTPREALALADEEARSLASLRLAGRPNPRAEARIVELKAIIQGRIEGNEVLAERARARGAMVWIGRFLGRRGSEFHVLSCKLLKGILTEVAQKSVPTSMTACAVCLPNGTPDPTAAPMNWSASETERAIARYDAERKQETAGYSDVASTLAENQKQRNLEAWQRLDARKSREPGSVAALVGPPPTAAGSLANPGASAVPPPDPGGTQVLATTAAPANLTAAPAATTVAPALGGPGAGSGKSGAQEFMAPATAGLAASSSTASESDSSSTAANGGASNTSTVQSGTPVAGPITIGGGTATATQMAAATSGAAPAGPVQLASAQTFSAAPAGPAAAFNSAAPQSTNAGAAVGGGGIVMTGGSGRGGGSGAATGC